MPAVTLPDGRTLAYAEAGPGDGRPVLVLHGAIGSPLRAAPELHDVVEALGVRYLMVSRPGFGASDPSPGRTLTGFADDLVALIDALGLGRAGLLGVSAGGPYAIACARRAPDRLSTVATVGSPSPAFLPWAAPGMARRTRVALRAVATGPAATARAGTAAVALVRRHPGLLLRAMTLGAGAGDRELLAHPARAEAAVAGFLAATAGGIDGLIDDYLLSTADWGFALADVQPEVHLWHGVKDALVPPVHAVHLAAHLPRRRVHFEPDAGHFFLLRRLGDILAPFAAAPAARAATG